MSGTARLYLLQGCQLAPVGGFLPGEGLIRIYIHVQMLP